MKGGTDPLSPSYNSRWRRSQECTQPRTHNIQSHCRPACLSSIDQPEGLAQVPQPLWHQEWEAEEEDGREAEMMLSLLFTSGAPSLFSGPGVQAPYNGWVSACRL